MTTITLKSPILEKYSVYELKLKFLNFLEKDLNQSNIDLYEIEVDNLPSSTQEKLQNIQKLNFIDY